MLKALEIYSNINDKLFFHFLLHIIFISFINFFKINIFLIKDDMKYIS